MKKKNIFLRIGIFCMIINIFLGTAICTADTTLNVPNTPQEHSNWCWAASSKAVLDYYGNVQTQCAIANWAWSRTDCCGNSTFDWNNTCNSTNNMYGSSGSLQNILSHWGVSSTALSTYLSQNTVVSEINGCRPFVIRFGWTSGGGHFLVGRGYDQSGAYVDYMDPIPGNGYTKSTYAYTVSASDHNWTHTLQITTIHACTSCPSLWYSSNGEAFEQIANIFGGAVGREEQYTDHILLKGIVSPDDGRYIFQIRETFPEDSFINMVKLIVIDHSADVDVGDLLLNGFVGLEFVGLEMMVLSPLSAVHSFIGSDGQVNHIDVMHQLCCPDNQYVPMSQGDSITLTFQPLPLRQEKRDFIFIGEGYYIPLDQSL